MITKVAFIGSKPFGLSVLQEIYKINPDSIKVVITPDDSKDERSNLAEFKGYCQSNRITFEVITKSSQLFSVITQYQPQLCLVAGWYWIIKKDLLKLVPKGWLGLHASLLPAYRGGAPLVWSIINGEEKSGVSLFYFDEGIDSGDIVAQKEFTITKQDTIKEVLEKAMAGALKLVSENYQELLSGRTSRHSQDNSQATYYPMRTAVDGHINWNWTSEKIYDFIRAQTHPYPGAFFWLPNQKMIMIWKAELINEINTGNPGTVLRIEDDQLYVICGEGTVIKLIQLDKDSINDISEMKLSPMIQLS